MSLLNNIKTRLANAGSLTFTKSIDSKTVSFFTDGSCTGNGSKVASVGGFAVVCVSGYIKNKMYYGKVDDQFVPATNIRAEGIAILTVLETLLNNVNSKEWNSAVIYTDSDFWKKMILIYMPRWNTQAFNSHKNPDLSMRMWAIWTKLKVFDKTIDIQHVYAHNKDKSGDSKDPFKKFSHYNNAIADDLAGIARELPDYDLREE